MNLALQLRLRVIDILVEQYGFVSRAVLMELHGTAATQATTDLAAYRKIAPDNIVLNQSSKRWVKTEIFKRQFK